MNKKFTFLMTAMALIFAIMGPRSVAWGQTTTVSYGWETGDDASKWVITETITQTENQGNTGSYAGKISTNHTYVQFKEKVKATSFSFAFKRTSNNSNYNVYIETSYDGSTWAAVETYAMSSFGNGTYSTKTHTFTNPAECYVRFHCYNTTAIRYVDDVTIEYTASTPSTDPSITVNPTTITWNDSPINVGLTDTISVSQANLTDDITISSTIGTVTPSTIAVGGEETDVTFTYTPTTVGDFEGTITFTSGETTATVSVTGSAYDPSQADTYTKVNSIADLTADDVFIIVGNNGSNYAMSNNNGTSSAPTAVAVTVTDDVITNPTNTILWTISGNATDGYTFYPYGSTETWLYCTDANNGLRVGNTTDSQNHRTFSIKDSYIFNNSRNRYLGIYSNSDWRSYTSINTNITGQTFAFYKKGGTPTVSAPTFSPASCSFLESQEVSISCATEGATISYTTDDWANSVEYTAPFTLTATTTVKAKATMTGMNDSNEATATYTKVEPLTTINAIFDASATAGDYYVTFNNWVVSGVKNKNAYVTDGYSGFIVFNDNHGFEVGDQISGTAQLALTRYNGAAEFTNLTSGTEGITVTTDGFVVPYPTNIADLGGVNTGAVIVLSNVTYTGDGFFSDGENTIKAYNAFMTLPSFTSGRQYNITGVYIQFGETKEIAPRTNDDIEEIVPTEPSITVVETLDIPYTGLEELETLEVTYENIDFDMLDLYFYDDPGCTIESENDWFIADFTEDGSHNIEYFASENTESTPRTVYMQIYYLYNDGESELTKVITVTQEAAPQTYNVTLSSNGVVNEPQPVQGLITLSDPTNIPTGFTFAGWTESESNIQFVANPYTPTSNVTLYAVFSRVEGGTTGSGNYEKVTSELTDWSGDYLIVYEGDNNHDAVAFDGSLETLDNTENGIGVSIENGIIAANEELVNSEFTIAAIVEGYSIMNKSGNFIGRTSSSNGLNTSETAIKNSLEISGNAMSISSGGCTLQYNYASNQLRFRYYTSSNQQPIQLYKKSSGTPGVTKYYTRVFNETATADITIDGPSIIPAGSMLNMGIYTLNNGEGSLLIEDGAQLVHSNADVAATLKKDVITYTNESERTGWNMFAAPFTGTVSTSFGENYELYTYDESTHYWMDSQLDLTIGSGYLFAKPESNTTDFELAGTLQASNVNLQYNLSYTETLTNGQDNVLKGFNLAGNPYPCNAYVDMDYQVLNAEGSGFINGKDIKPGDAILVQATGANQKITFSKNPLSGPNIVVDLCVSQNRGSVIDNARIRFGEGQAMNKFYLNESGTRLYIPQNGQDFAVVSTQTTTHEMPVNFKAEKNGTYTITANTENVEAEYIHLIDNMTGMDVDLLSTPSYTFSAKTSDYASRFKLVFSVNDEASASANNFAFMSDGNLVISNIEGEATLQIVDMMGRVLSTETVSANYNKALNLRAGVYVLNLNGMTQKIVVE